LLEYSVFKDRGRRLPAAVPDVRLKHTPWDRWADV
jgi:hypothetical protein